MIKKVLSGLACVMICCVYQCGQLFPTTFDRVDADRVRVLDYIYDPPEAAPGDTVTVKAIFAGAGDSLQPADVAWSASFKMLSNLNGVDTALDIRPLELLSYEQSYFSTNTSCLVLRFKVPDSVLFQSPMIPEDWTKSIPNQTMTGIPDFIRNIGKNTFLTLIDSISAKARLWGGLFLECLTQQDTLLLLQTLSSDQNYMMYQDTLKYYMPAILQLLTVKIRLFADIKDAYRVRSDYFVRYNNRFKNIPGSKAYINNNPHIDSVGIYSVKKEGLIEFNPAQTSYEYRFQRLYGEEDSLITDTIPDSLRVITIDKGYSYFVAGFTRTPDLSMTIDSAIFNGSPVNEILFSQYFFQLSEEETQGVSAYDFMNIVNAGNLSAPLYPSLDKNIKTATLWLQVYDYLLNEINRPKASALKEVKIAFTYTSAYLIAVKKKKQ